MLPRKVKKDGRCYSLCERGNLEKSKSHPFARSNIDLQASSIGTSQLLKSSTVSGYQTEADRRESALTTGVRARHSKFDPAMGANCRKRVIRQDYEDA